MEVNTEMTKSEKIEQEIAILVEELDKELDEELEEKLERKLDELNKELEIAEHDEHIEYMNQIDEEYDELYRVMDEFYGIKQ